MKNSPKPMTEASLSEAPAHLSNASRQLWSDILQDYRLDAAAIAVLVGGLEALDRRETARAALATGGLTVTDRFGQKKPNPLVLIERDCAMTWMRSFKTLGLDQIPEGKPDATPRP
ncbi:MAG: hypothetical protein ABI824_15920 [Acidobacteriota bacterium]